MQDRAKGSQGVAARSGRALGWWRDPKIRQVIYQILVVIGVALFAGYLVANTMANLEARSIRTGFGFLSNEAGFNIGGDSLISYDASESYGRAFLVGVVNTLYVALLGIGLTIILGTMKFLLVSVVLLPILPSEPIDPWDVYNLQEIWLLVVLVSGWVATSVTWCCESRIGGQASTDTSAS